MQAAPPAGSAAPAGPDAIDDALALAGLTRKDLGWEGRGWWDRYPQDIPYKLLRKVMYTSARANYSDVAFAVRRRDGT